MTILEHGDEHVIDAADVRNRDAGYRHGDSGYQLPPEAQEKSRILITQLEDYVGRCISCRS